MKGEISGWRSAEAERLFRSIEDELIAEQWPDGVDAVDVDTGFGTTHVYRWIDRGPSAGVPIVFLHGMGGTGATWAAYVERLARHDVYALDTIGDVGRSVQRAVITDADDLARWLDETLAALGIEHCHLVGTSYGGWLALNLAARRPARVAALTLIDSGGLAPFRLGRFMLWGMPMLLGWLAPNPIRRRLARTRPLLEDRRLMRMALRGQRNHPFRLPKPEPLTDAQLAAIRVPTTVIVAGRSAPFDPRVAAARARTIPGATVDVLDDAGHEVSWSHVDRCLSHVESATPNEDAPRAGRMRSAPDTATCAARQAATARRTAPHNDTQPHDDGSRQLRIGTSSAPEQRSTMLAGMALLELDHVVIHVDDWASCNAFYVDVLGFERIDNPEGRANPLGASAYRLGGQQINVHGPWPGQSEPCCPPPLNEVGRADLAFRTSATAEQNVEMLERSGIRVVAGPVRRFGALGWGTSIYCHDPSGNGVELIAYPGA